MLQYIRKTIDTVNHAIPSHRKDALSPYEMRRTGHASCVGRVVLIGAGLTLEGIGADSLYLWIEARHGKPRKEAAWWFGHGLLAVGIGQACMKEFEAGGFLFSDATREPGDPTFPASGAVIDAPEQAAILTGLVPPTNVASPRGAFSAYPIQEGLTYYQEAHPAYEGMPSYTLAEYVDLYVSL